MSEIKLHFNDSKEFQFFLRNSLISGKTGDGKSRLLQDILSAVAKQYSDPAVRIFYWSEKDEDPFEGMEIPQAYDVDVDYQDYPVTHFISEMIQELTDNIAFDMVDSLTIVCIDGYRTSVNFNADSFNTLLAALLQLAPSCKACVLMTEQLSANGDFDDTLAEKVRRSFKNKFYAQCSVPEEPYILTTEED